MLLYCTVQECDARLVAEIEEEKLRDAELEKKRVEHERTEKAYLRHKHALEKELLKEVECTVQPLIWQYWGVANELKKYYWYCVFHPLQFCYRQPFIGDNQTVNTQQASDWFDSLTVIMINLLKDK